MNNQPVKSTDKGKRLWCGSLEHLRITSKESPIGIFYHNAKKDLGDGYFSTVGKEGCRRFIGRSRENFIYARGVIDE